MEFFLVFLFWWQIPIEQQNDRYLSLLGTAQWWSSKLRRRSSSVRISLNSLPKSDSELLSSLVFVVELTVVFDLFDSLVSLSFAWLSIDSVCIFCKLVGVTNSRSNAFGNASPSRSLLEHTLSWSSQPSTDPTPSSGNVSSYNIQHEVFNIESNNKLFIIIELLWINPKSLL